MKLVRIMKKEALTLPGAGVRFPVQLQQSSAPNEIVHRFSEKVNIKISESTQSQQFKRWFGDWQNDPASASKVVNEDGTPKVVYHGTNAEFTVFDLRKNGKNLSVCGRGIGLPKVALNVQVVKSGFMSMRFSQ